MRQEDPRTSSWASHMLRLEPGSVTLEAQEPYRTKDFCQMNSAPAENCNFNFSSTGSAKQSFTVLVENQTQNRRTVFVNRFSCNL